MVLTHQASIEAPVETVWNLIWDVQRFAFLLPGCKSITVVEDGKKYMAEVEAKVGPFKTHFQMEIDIVQIEEGTYLKAFANGKDLKTSTFIKGQTFEVRLRPASPQQVWESQDEVGEKQESDLWIQSVFRRAFLTLWERLKLLTSRFRFTGSQTKPSRSRPRTGALNPPSVTLPLAEFSRSQPTFDRTEVEFVTEVTLIGKLARLGHGVVERKADEMMRQFIGACKKELEGVQEI